jgi:hypothetical protein
MRQVVQDWLDGNILLLDSILPVSMNSGEATLQEQHTICPE